MDTTLLIDVCVGIATALCFALLLYGARLCLPELGEPESSDAEQGSQDEIATGIDADAVIRPRPRVRAGTGSR